MFEISQTRLKQKRKGACSVNLRIGSSEFCLLIAYHCSPSTVHMPPAGSSGCRSLVRLSRPKSPFRQRLTKIPDFDRYLSGVKPILSKEKLCFDQAAAIRHAVDSRKRIKAERYAPGCAPRNPETRRNGLKREQMVH